MLVTFLVSTLKFLGVFLLVLVVFNLMIVVHELGHFLAARWRGLRVDKFQIWFGRCIWKKTINGVQYGLGTIPAGGFVSLPQMAMESIEGQATSDDPLPPVKPLDKIIVAFAGPLFSFLLAIFFAVIVWIVKYPESRASNSTTIGLVLPGGAGEKAGLQPGDVVQAVGNHPVTTFMGMSQSVKWEIITSKTDRIPFDILREGKPMRIEVNAPLPKPDKGEKWYARIFRRPQMREVGLAPASGPVFVGGVMKNSPAEQAGIREGDELLEMDGKPLFTFATMALHVAEHKPDAVSLKVLREGKPLEVTIRPRVPEVPGDFDPTVRRVGMTEMADDDPRRPEQYRDNQLKRDTPLALIIKPIKSMYHTLAAVSTPGTGVGPAHLSGAPMIIFIYYKMLVDDPDGWRLVLWFSVFLNVNLAIMNLLPIPVLDGGHIMTSLYEMVARRPLPAEFMRVVYQGCALLLFGFMIFIAGFDFRDIFRNVSYKEKKPFEFLATGATS
jgi:regulator of sigma E protease